MATQQPAKRFGLGDVVGWAGVSVAVALFLTHLLLPLTGQIITGIIVRIAEERAMVIGRSYQTETMDHIHTFHGETHGTGVIYSPNTGR